MVNENEEVLKMREILIRNLNRYFKRNGINQTDMARDLSFPETTVSNWMKGKTYPRPDKLQMMADYFGVTRSDLTEDIPANVSFIRPDFVKVPILGEISCGNPLTVMEQAESYMYELRDGLPQGDLFALIAKGESMTPTITDGSKVLVRVQNDVENGEIAAVLLNGDTEATLKRVKKQGEATMLVPDNTNYEIILVNEQNPARIIGKVVRAIKDFT